MQQIRSRCLVVVRFVDKSNQIREEFIGFVTCEKGTDRETLSVAILKLVQGWGLNKDNCRGQAYDEQLTGFLCISVSHVHPQTQILFLHQKFTQRI